MATTEQQQGNAQIIFNIANIQAADKKVTGFGFMPNMPHNDVVLYLVEELPETEKINSQEILTAHFNKQLQNSGLDEDTKNMMSKVVPTSLIAIGPEDGLESMARAVAGIPNTKNPMHIKLDVSQATYERMGSPFMGDKVVATFEVMKKEKK